MKKSVTIVVFAGLAISLSGQTPQATPAAPSQPAPASSQAAFKAGGEEVLLDVVVRDKKGRAINDLKEGDFTVSDNGEKREIKSFRLVQGGESVSTSGARTQLDPLRQIRLITLIFSGLSPEGRRLAREASLSLLKTDLEQNVYIAVMAIDHKLEAIQSFTNDRELLRKAVEHATGGANDFTRDSIQVRQQLEQMLGPNQGGAQSVADRAAELSNGSTATTGAGAAPAAGAAANAAMANMMVQILRTDQEDAGTDWGRANIFALLTAVKEQYRLPGRKSLLYFTEGLSIPQGMEEPFNSVIAIANRCNVSFYPIIASGLNTWSSASNASGALNNAANSSKANATSASSGVNTWMATSVDQQIESGRADPRVALLALAGGTGGSLIADTNDFKTPLKKLNEELETYYEITYDPQIAKYDGAFRKVSVRTAEADLKIQSRSGYFALPPSMTARGQVLSTYEVPLLTALDEKPFPHPFSFQAAGLHFRGTNQPTCEVMVAVPLASMTMTQNKETGIYEGKLAYVAVLKDGQGEVVKKFKNEIPLKITADKLDAYKASYFRYNQSFDMPPGHYTMETAVLDGAGEKISVKKSALVIPPQSTTLGISSVAVINNLKPKDDTTKPDDPMLMIDKVITPTVGPVLKKSESQEVPFFVVIYPNSGNLEKPALRMEFSRDGQRLGAGSPPLGAPDAKGEIQYVARVPLASFQPGNYEVKFVATQGKEAAEESITFTLEP